jgi:hypothetical protein
MLCALGAAVFATAIKDVVSTFTRTMTWIALATGFALMTWFVSNRVIDASWIGGLAAILAAWQLVRPGRLLVVMAAAGAMAALWGTLLQVAGVPRLLAVPVSAIVPVVSASLAARRPTFAPQLLREDATLAMLLLAVMVGAAPTISEGWRSAHVLNATDPTAASVFLPIWMMSFVGAAMALGGVWSLWRRG